MVAGISGGSRSGAVALADQQRVVGVCAQERVTRLKGAGVNHSGLPDEALDLLLSRRRRSRSDVSRFVVADGRSDITSVADVQHLDHHYAHAATAYLTSPFAASAIVVCDHAAPGVSVWRGEGGAISRIEWPWNGAGFADVFSRFAVLFGGNDQRFEALARLRPLARDSRIDGLIGLNDDGLVIHPSFDATVEGLLRQAGDEDARASIAASLQGRLGGLLVEFLSAVRKRTGAAQLAVGGSHFYHSAVNTVIRQSGVFDRVFVPVDPGNSGLAVGAALHGIGSSPSPVSPFLGPSYSSQETKEMLDNCKLQYSLESEQGAIDAAIKALRQGWLVGWFDDAMEWGPRSLGARCILADPMAPYVLENLNVFLKRREPWRGYALSMLQEGVDEHFEGPASAPFMECDYRPRDPARFRHALPSEHAAVRVQTVGDEVPPRFARLLRQFGEATGVAALVNTSFNGFYEPVVCTPRDAVRVFYGTGIDLLIVNQFVLRK